MKLVICCMLLGSESASFGESKAFRFAFPPFAEEDLATLGRPIQEYFPVEELLPENEPIIVSAKELRSVMMSGNSAEQTAAARKLIEREDQDTILRVVYSLKQGNSEAIDLLGVSTLSIIPYLMEDVAHGSMEYFKGYIFGDGVIEGSMVRKAAVERVASLLSGAEEFTDETRNCLKAIGRGRSDQVQGLSDKSRYLVEWWLLNKDHFESKRWNDLRPLNYNITYLDSRRDTFFSPAALWDKESNHSYGSPMWELPESFEAWAERIVDPKRRNLDFVALSWDGKKVVEHPATSVHPRTKPAAAHDRESRKTTAPRNSLQSDSGSETRGISWWVAVSLAMVVVLIALGMKRRSGVGN